MLKFAVAAVWICAVTVGSIFFAFSAAGPKSEEEVPAYFGGLDYVKTDILSIPVVKNGGVHGYFLARLVYTVKKDRVSKLSVPAQPLIVDQLYTYLYTNPEVDFSTVESVDTGALKEGIRKSVNDKLGEEFIHEILIEQLDFLSKTDIRDNNMRRKTTTGSPQPPTEPETGGHEAPAH